LYWFKEKEEGEREQEKKFIEMYMCGNAEVDLISVMVRFRISDDDIRN
jgi:hypothetical protein